MDINKHKKRLKEIHSNKPKERIEAVQILFDLNEKALKLN